MRTEERCSRQAVLWHVRRPSGDEILRHVPGVPLLSQYNDGKHVGIKTKEPPKIQNLHMHTAHFTSNSVRYLHEQCEYKRTISKTFSEDICTRSQQAVPFRTKQCVASQGTSQARVMMTVQKPYNLFFLLS